jgi:hypothetical protein
MASAGLVLCIRTTASPAGSEAFNSRRGPFFAKVDDCTRLIDGRLV